MNLAKRRIGELACIRDLRALTEQIAEARASRRVRKAEVQRAICWTEEERLEHTLQHWRSALAAGRFDPVRSATLGQAVHAQHRTTIDAYQQLDALAQARDEALHECARARAGHRCANELLAAARRHDARQRDERALAAQDDANPIRGLRWSR